MAFREGTQHMGKLSKKEEAELAARLDDDESDATAWEDDSPAAGDHKRTLGAVVSIRLSPAHAEQLRAIASGRGVGYTTLVRAWVEERLLNDAVTAPNIVQKLQVTASGEARVDQVQMSGWGSVSHQDDSAAVA